MGEHPSVSVVMPVRNEALHIEAAIDAVLAQDYPGPIELVVADGGSTDDTRQIVDRLAAGHARVRVVENPDGHAAAGLNRAIAASTGVIVVRCDGHAQLAPDYVRTAVEVLEQTGAANVGGRQAAIGEGFVQGAIAVAMTSPLGVGNARFHYADTAQEVDTVYLGVFRRSAIETAGGFDETLVRNQDYELNHRLRRAGEIVWFDPRLQVRYHPRRSLAALARQYFDYGAWKRRMLSRSPEALKTRQLAPPLLVIGLVLSAILLAIGRTIGWWIPAAYVLFVALGSGLELIRRRDIRAALLVAVLPTMHLSWGTGFLFGRAR